MVLSLVGSLHRCLKRQALLESGFPLEHPSGAKMLAQPNHYEPLMQLMRLNRFKHGARPGRDLHEGPPATLVLLRGGALAHAPLRQQGAQ